MNEVRDIQKKLYYKNKINNIRFEKRKLIIGEEDGNIKEFFFIVLNNKLSKRMKITGYSKFLIVGLLNKRSTTIDNYCKVIVSFLNYIFFDNYDKYCIKDIREIKFEYGNDYIRDLSEGKIGKNKKTKDSIIKVENKLTKFYYFLSQEISDLRYINKDDFEFVKVKKKNSVQEKLVLKSKFLVLYNDTTPPKRIKSISNFLFSEIIKTCEIYYPELVLAICLQAFGGLRKGEVCNISKDKINFYKIGKDFAWFTIDLRKKTALRDDLINVGNIKKARIQPIHPVFLKIYKEVYENHLEIISKSKNKYGAFFLTKDDKAMTEGSYNQKFKRIIKLTIKRLSERSYLNNELEQNAENSFGFNVITNYYESASEINKLSSAKINTHIFRHFFTQFVASLDNRSATEIAYWRGDSSLESAIVYLTGSPVINESIKDIQSEVYKMLLKGKRN